MHQLVIHTYAELEAMPASDIDRWRHFFRVEPAGYLADNWRAGVAAAALVNVTARLKRHEQLKPSDLYPDPHKMRLSNGPASVKAARGLMASLKASYSK